MNAALIFVALAATTAPDLQRVIDQMRAEQDVPGVSAVVTRRGEVLFAGASGQANLESGQPMTPDTVLYAVRGLFIQNPDCRGSAAVN